MNRQLRIPPNVSTKLRKKDKKNLIQIGHSALNPSRRMTGKVTNRQNTGGIRNVTRHIDAGPSTRQASVLLVHLDRLAQNKAWC